MKVFIDSDEIYPVYSISEYNWGVECDIPVDIVESFKQAEKEWEHWQNVLENYHDKAYENKKLKYCNDNGITPKGF